MPDFDKALGQQVQAEASYELWQLQGHGFAPFMIGVVLVGEGERLAVSVEEAAIGDGHPMGVVGQVFEHLLRTGKGAFGINHPVVFGGRAEQTRKL